MPNETLVSADDLIEVMVASTEVFSHHRVKYSVIGGMAAGYRSQPRYTKDLDFLLTIPQLQLPAVLESLSERGFQFDTMSAIREWTQEHMTVLSYHGFRIDWLKPVIPMYQHVLEHATEEIWLDHPIRVASAEGLILLKMLAYRLQDQIDIENLVAAKRSKLDMDWIRSEWQAVAPLSDPRMLRLEELIRLMG